MLLKVKEKHGFMVQSEKVVCSICCMLCVHLIEYVETLAYKITQSKEVSRKLRGGELQAQKC